MVGFLSRSPRWVPIHRSYRELLDRQNEPKPKLIDSSAPLFSLYNKKTKEHDEKMAESWKGDADGILVFVCENKLFFPRHPLRCHIIDWFVLSGRCTTPWKCAWEPPAEPSKCFIILSCSHISAHPRFECVVHSTPRRSSYIQATHVRHIRQHTLVLQPCD
jgi:hypothetical protein